MLFLISLFFFLPFSFFELDFNDGTFFSRRFARMFIEPRGALHRTHDPWRLAPFFFFSVPFIYARPFFEPRVASVFFFLPGWASFMPITDF